MIVKVNLFVKHICKEIMIVFTFRSKPVTTILHKLTQNYHYHNHNNYHHNNYTFISATRSLIILMQL